MASPPAHGGSFRVVRTARVAPSSPAAGAGCNPQPEAALPLTFLDAMWLIAPPVERVFFYRLGDGGGGATCDVDVALSRLVDSLARALHVFYPLAGRLRRTPGKANRYELFYQPGDAVAFTVAEHDGVAVDELATDDPREVARIEPLVLELPDGGAVLAVQATVLLRPAAPRGLALGVTVHHAACDGSSSTNFLHTWAAICSGAAATPMAPPPSSTAHTHHVKTRTTNSPDPDVVDSKLLATFTLSRENLQSIRDRVAAVAARRGVLPPRCTSVVATFAVIWRCHVRAALGAGGDVEAEPRNHGRRAHLVFATDLRSRMEPRVPDKYLGNCIGTCFASAPRTDIAATGADGLFAACAAIAAAVDEGMRYDEGYWDRCREHSAEVTTWPLSVAGSPRFRVYDVDFGFGSPAKVEIVSVAKTGAMSVAEGRGGCSGGIEIEVGIALSPERMERFRRCFGDDVAWLSS
uniref:Uncharacterized protein n=1 Tax=Oryza barthii TaxID=65489 RepID=A0A0D3F578_9ORYZ